MRRESGCQSTLKTDWRECEACAHRNEVLRSILSTSYGQEKLEFWGQLVFGVESIREVDASNTAVGVDLNSIHVTSEISISLNTKAVIRNRAPVFELL